MHRSHQALDQNCQHGLERLTTLHNETWSLIVDSENIYIVIRCGDLDSTGEMVIRHEWYQASRAKFQEVVSAWPLADRRPLGCIALSLCTDHNQHGAIQLVSWLASVAGYKKFNVMVIPIPARTSEIFSAQKLWFDRNREATTQTANAGLVH